MVTISPTSIRRSGRGSNPRSESRSNRGGDGFETDLSLGFLRQLFHMEQLACCEMVMCRESNCSMWNNLIPGVCGVVADWW